MKLSDHIADLQQLYAEHGDIDINIFLYDSDGETGEPYLCLCEEEDGTIKSVTLGDVSYADAFAECEDDSEEG